MTDRGMPLLIINLGGEMVYILEQRLHAQSISSEKRTRVMQDVVRTMFNSKFLQELFKPQAMYTPASTRGIFDRLAHSSIMRLSESSMDKLYDLMTMGFKYQLVLCRHPADLLAITLNHLNSEKAIVGQGPVRDMIEGCITLCKQTYGKLTLGEFQDMRQALLQFFHSKRIKVSLFLQDGLQNRDGTIVLRQNVPVPPGADVPGAIRYFSGGKVGTTTSFSYSLGAKPALKPHTTELGLNLYSKDRKKAAQITTAPADASAATQRERKPSVTSKSAKAELNLLADLIGRGSAAPSTPNLLNINDLFGDGGGAGSSSGNVVRAQRKGGKDDERVRGLMGDLSVKDSGKAASLLDLMDSA